MLNISNQFKPDNSWNKIVSFDVRMLLTLLQLYPVILVHLLHWLYQVTYFFTVINKLFFTGIGTPARPGLAERS